MWIDYNYEEKKTRSISGIYGKKRNFVNRMEEKGHLQVIALKLIEEKSHYCHFVNFLFQQFNIFFASLIGQGCFWQYFLGQNLHVFLCKGRKLKEKSNNFFHFFLLISSFLNFFLAYFCKFSLIFLFVWFFFLHIYF